MNHVLNLAVQVFLKKIKALPAKEVVVYEIDEDEDEDEDVDDDDDMEIDDDEGDGGDHIVLNPERVEEDAEYVDIADDFQGTLKKLRGVAKVRDVAHKITFALLSN
jgi:hypothetical protein